MMKVAFALVLGIMVGCGGSKKAPTAPTNSGGDSAATGEASPAYQECLATSAGLSPGYSAEDWAKMSQAEKEGECSAIDADAEMPLDAEQAGQEAAGK